MRVLSLYMRRGILLTKLLSFDWTVWNGRGRCYSRVRRQKQNLTLSSSVSVSCKSEVVQLRSSTIYVENIRKFSLSGLYWTNRCRNQEKPSNTMPKLKLKRKSDTQSVDLTEDLETDTKSPKKPKVEKKVNNEEAITALDVPEKYTTDRKSEEGKEANLKISSWNVGGLNAWLKKDGISYIAKEHPDIFFIMETKVADNAVPEKAKEVEGYHTYWYGATAKKGYSGTGLYTKKEPINVKYGIDIEEHDAEGRVITAEFEDFYFVGCYVPNSGRGLVRLEYRKTWDLAFHEYLVNLDKTKPVILCGDLNVAHQEIDLKNPKPNHNKTPGFTDEERDGFTAFLDKGFVDSFRHLYPDREYAYSFWTYMGNCRSKNVGWRLDYFVISKRLVPKLCDTDLRTWILGSDHCPIVLHMAM